MRNNDFDKFNDDYNSFNNNFSLKSSTSIDISQMLISDEEDYKNELDGTSPNFQDSVKTEEENKNFKKGEINGANFESISQNQINNENDINKILPNVKTDEKTENLIRNKNSIDDSVNETEKNKEEIIFNQEIINSNENNINEIIYILNYL